MRVKLYELKSILRDQLLNISTSIQQTKQNTVATYIKIMMDNLAEQLVTNIKNDGPNKQQQLFLHAHLLSYHYFSYNPKWEERKGKNRNQYNIVL